MIFLELFYTFFCIGLFTIGGGYAMISLIQTQVVDVHGWITAQTFADVVAISQMTPGPIGINSATYVGYSIAETMGYSQPLCVTASLLATCALVLPSFLVTYWICRFYVRFKSNNVFSSVLKCFKPLAIGLMAAAAILLATPETFIDPKSWLFFAGAFILLMWGKLSPILVIILAGTASYFVYI